MDQDPVEVFTDTPQPRHPTRRIGRRDFRQSLAVTLDDLVAGGGELEITHNNVVEAVMMTSARAKRASDAEQELKRMRVALPMLVAAARAGANIAPDFFEVLCINVDVD